MEYQVVKQDRAMEIISRSNLAGFILVCFFIFMAMALGFAEITSVEYAKLAQTSERCPAVFSKAKFEDVNWHEYMNYRFQCDREEEAIKRANEIKKIAQIKSEIAIVQQQSK